MFVSRTTLKLIATFSMICDHFAFMFLQKDSIAYFICRMIVGRWAFPIFVFLFADGIVQTKNIKHKITLLLWFAIISEPIYDKFFMGNWIDNTKQNIMWTWLLVALLFLIFSQLKKMQQISNIAIVASQTIIAFLFIIVAEYLNLDYGGTCIIIVSILYGYKQIRINCQNWEIGIIICLIENIFYSTPAVFLILPALTKKHDIIRKTHSNYQKLKYWFYIIYPLHLLILMLIKYFFI